MEVQLQSLGIDVWQADKDEYKFLSTPSTQEAEIKLRKDNVEVINAILSGLTYSKRNRVGKCKTTKEIWNKLHNIYTKVPLLVTT